MTPSARLSSLLRQGPVIAPGVVDPLTASLAAGAGFQALYVTGAGLAYTRLGQPDVGLMTLTEVAEAVSRIADRIETPLIVDGDTGHGNAMNVQRMVRMLEAAGAAAVQIEDQTFPKRCGHLADKTVIPAGEMVGKIKAALDARRHGLLVIARTDAGAVEGFEAAFDRARRYAEAGADLIFVEAPRTRAELESVPAALKGVAPLVVNMVEGGRTPMVPAGELAAMGFGLIVFSAGVVRAMAHAASAYYQAVARDGGSAAMNGRMFDFTELAEIVGTSALLEKSRAYGGGDA